MFKKLIIIFIISALIVFFIYFLSFSYNNSMSPASESPLVPQITKGNWSPPIRNIDGDITINHNISDVDKEVKKLKKANIAFTSPSKMNKNNTYIITLHLSPSKASKELLEEIKDGEKESATIKYSARMQAKLIGENKRAFEITPITPDIQAISTIIDITTWKWDVTPLEEGKQYLHLVLSAFLNIEGKETSLQIKTFDKKIKVEISMLNRVSEFIRQSWKWLLGSLLFPIVAWYWKLKYPQKES